MYEMCCLFILIAEVWAAKSYSYTPSPPPFASRKMATKMKMS